MGNTKTREQVKTRNKPGSRGQVKTRGKPETRSQVETRDQGEPRDESETSFPAQSDLARVVHDNIEQLIEIREAEERKKGFQEKAADLLTRFSGSMLFVYVHAVWFGLWIALNVGWLGEKPFDPFPFSLLTLIVSLEAIFLSTFVLISQNHASQMADKRADLDLQINLLSEHEITRLLTLMDAVASHLGIELPEQPEVEELKKDTGAGQVLKEIESRESESDKLKKLKK